MQLERQLGFLRNSCVSYDAGSIDESIRIALAIRVLIHDTRNPTSLLRHLNAQHINLATTVEDGPAPDALILPGMAWLQFTSEGATWRPATTQDAIKGYLCLPKWWNQTGLWSRFIAIIKKGFRAGCRR